MNDDDARARAAAEAEAKAAEGKQDTACRDPECTLSRHYVECLAPDMVQSKNMSPLLHMAAAIGLLLGAGAKKDEEFAMVLEAIERVMRKAANDTRSSLPARAAVKLLVQKAAIEQGVIEPEDAPAAASEAASETMLKTTLLNVSVPTGTDPKTVLEAAREMLAKTGARVAGMAVFGPDGSLLSNEGDIPAEMMPSGAKAPAGKTKH